MCLLLLQISTSGCGTTKGCYRSPPGCTGQRCQYVATYVNSGNDVNFELLYRPAPNTGDNWWVALGFSDDTRMVRHQLTLRNLISIVYYTENNNAKFSIIAFYFNND